MPKREKFLDKPIIFIGPGRSGSTIISEFIMVHEQLAWPSNYLEFYPRINASNTLRRLFDNRLWRLTGEKAQKVNRTKRFNEAIPRPSEAYPFWEHITRDNINFSRGFLMGETATKKEREKIRKLFSNLVKAQGRQRLSIKLTGPGRIAYLHSIFPDAIFINIIRDTEATVRSLLNVPFWKELGMHQLWWTGAYSETELQHYQSISHDPVASTTFQLEKILQTTKREAQQCGANMTTIHYEDFVTSPTAVIEQILQITGLPESKWITKKLRTTAIQQRNHIGQKNSCTP